MSTRGWLLGAAALAAVGAAFYLARKRRRDADAAASTTIDAVQGQTFEIVLPSNPSTGYQWTIQAAPTGLVSLRSDEYTSDASEPGLVGGGGHQRLVLVGEAPGTATLTLRYRRTFEESAEPAEVRVYTVNVRAKASSAGAQEGLVGDPGAEGALSAILAGLGGAAPKPSAPKPAVWYVKTDKGYDATPFGKSDVLARIADYQLRPSTDARYFDDAQRIVSYEGTHKYRVGSSEYTPLAPFVASQRANGYVVLIDKANVDDFATLASPRYVQLYVTRDPELLRATSPWARDNVVLVG